METPPHATPLPARVATNRRVLLEGAVLGAAYGILLRLFAGWPALSRWYSAHLPAGFSAVMTWAFIFGGPFVIGFLCVTRASKLAPVSWVVGIFAPWMSILVMMTALWLFFIEGWICILMALPIALVISSLGGALAKLDGDRASRRSGLTLSFVALLPFVAAPMEARLNSPTQTRTVSSEVRIHADPALVWQNIERVPAISAAELRSNWTHRIGFPRPVAATLSYEGIGGVRHASFERGLLFIETVTAWEPERRLAFSIRADSAHLPATTLDEHVMIGGRYFDVLDGEYSLEALGRGDVMLHLVSHQRLSTDFNGYAGLWTDSVMQNLQTSILEVIKHRCERS